MCVGVAVEPPPVSVVDDRVPDERPEHLAGNHRAGYQRARVPFYMVGRPHKHPKQAGSEGVDENG